MSTWVYFAAASQANLAATINFALASNIIYRPARKQNGDLNAYLAQMAPADRILMVYRQAGQPHQVQLCARIAEVATPVAGTQVIERVPFAPELAAAGYIPVAPGFGEVIQLQDVHECQYMLVGNYPIMGAIRPLDPADSVFERHCPQCGAEATGEESPRPHLSEEIKQPPEAVRAESTPFEPLRVEPTQAPQSDSRVFDVYLMVDWSSKSTPATGKDSVWLGWGEWDGLLLREGNENPRTRCLALSRMREMLEQWQRTDKRVLLGLDFAFGYPCGFAAALGFTRPAWRAILEHFHQHVQDDMANRHNRDLFASACNACIGGGPGPFWGCHAGAVTANLTTQRIGQFDFPYRGLENYRTTEDRVRSRGITTQPVWKLNQGVSVGGQTILGIKYLADLRWHSPETLSETMRIWPFETGWGLPTDGRIVIAEIFPSLLPLDEDIAESVNDLAQVRTCVRHAAQLDAQGQLAAWFGQPPSLAMPHSENALTEEGWILFSSPPVAATVQK